MTQAWYAQGLRSIVQVAARPLAVVTEEAPEDIVESLNCLTAPERTPRAVDDALDAVSGAAFVLGVVAAVLAIAATLAGSVAGIRWLDTVGVVLLGLTASFGVLLVIARVRGSLGRRRYSDVWDLPVSAVPSAEPQGWEILPMLIAIGFACWLVARR